MFVSACIVLAISVEPGLAAQSLAPDEWAWIGGSNLPPSDASGGSAGVYGTLGTPAAKNIPGGRENAASLPTAKGTFGSSEAMATIPPEEPTRSTICGNSTPVRKSGPG